MEWTNRASQNAQPASQPAANTPVSAKRNSAQTSLIDTLFKFSTVALLFSGTILLLAVLVYVVRGGANNQGKYVNNKQMQAVFLNGGQVYFGHINNLNSQYLRMSDIYYLRVNQTVQPNQTNNSASNNDVSLVKLGCELHGPQDSMVVNQSQVIFWENLKDDGQVAKAVAEYKKQNPNGQKCDTTSQTNSQSNTTTTPTTTPTTDTTKKP